MAWFKFNWFTSKEKEELENLRKKEVEALKQQLQAVQQELEDKKYTIPVSIPAPVESTRVYKNLYYSNGIITLTTKTGDVFTKTEVDTTFVEKVKNAPTEQDIIDLFITREKVNPNIQLDTLEERTIVNRNLGVLKDHKEFEIHNDEVFLVGVSLAMPTIVVASFIEILEKRESLKHQFRAFGAEDHKVDEAEELDNQFMALKMFWLKLALNGIEQSRTDLLNFCRNNDVRITTNGNLVLYRRIVTVGDSNKKLVEFISQEYYKVKRWKKSPANYFVIDKDGLYTLGCLTDGSNYSHLTDDDIAGNLYDLYTELPNMTANEYTSWHNRGKHIIKIGSIYKIDEKGINLDNGLCAAGGLHAAAVTYNYGGFGDTPVVVLVNPSKAITVPTGETGKLRTTEMFVACINDKDHGIHFDDSALSAFDEEYNNLTIAELEEAIKGKSFAPASVENQVSPITFVDMETIKDLLKQRTIEIV